MLPDIAVKDTNDASITSFTSKVILQRAPRVSLRPDDFALTTEALPSVRDGEVLLATAYLSIDPVTRLRLEPRSPFGEVAVGTSPSSSAVARVLVSRAPTLRAGDVVTARLPWQSHVVVDAREVRRVPHGDVKLTWYLGALGGTGFSAYVGLFIVANLQRGETVFVSAAAGAVGSVAGQLAKRHGCRVVGSTRHPDKALVLRRDLGFDAVVDAGAGDLDELLHAACPEGIDVNFENVGGTLMNAVMRHMRPRGRVALCGSIASYDGGSSGVDLRPAIAKQLRIEGFLVGSHADRAAEFEERMLGWLRRGDVRALETVTAGLASAPRAMVDQLAGRNLGKQLVRVASD